MSQPSATSSDSTVPRSDEAGPATTEGRLVEQAIHAVRFLSIDAVQAANSGHPGAPMGLAPLAYVLYTRHLRHDPAAPEWTDRDRLVLSAGHASMLLYASLHLAGYALSLDDLRAFRQWASRTPGHPERGETVGVEMTTGPLGQGVANAVGMALAERHLAERFNRPGHTLIDHRTWAICSDGDLMEGISNEAASLAGRLGAGLHKLTLFYDDNDVTLDGPRATQMNEDVGARFRALGWHVQRVEDVNDLAALDAAIAAARAETARPSLVTVRTHIGYGSPVQDTHKAHGAPLGADKVAATRAKLGWEHAPFVVPDEVYAHWRAGNAARAEERDAWRARLDAWREAEPELAADFDRRGAGRLPAGWRDALPTFAPGGELATRKSGAQVLGALSRSIPELIGGAADLSSSTYTIVPDSPFHDSGDWSGRNVQFGVREHAMGAIANGIAAHGGLRPFCSTFLVFSDYMRTPIRLAALMRLRVIFVYTHDSIGVGEDGPTHQPVEQVASLRAMPGLRVFRPADANEVAAAWAAALDHDGPSVLVFSRQNLPHLDPAALDVAGALLVPGDDAAIVSSGSEVHLALAASELLAARGIAARVVSLPSHELYRARPRAEREALLPPGLPTLAVEAGSPTGWHEFADDVLGLTRFGASAPGEVLFEKLGFTPEAVAERVQALLGAR